MSIDAALERFVAILPDHASQGRELLARASVAASQAGYALDLTSFAAALARHAQASGDAGAYLEGARVEDLALAHACATGDARALSTFEKLYFAEIDRAFHKVRRGAVDPQDFAQRVRERLFVASEDRTPRIADYAGQGDLRTWFRVVVSRTLVNEAMRPKRDEPTDDEELAELPGRVADPELELLRRKYAEEFKAAFARTLAAMDARDRAILAYVVKDKLSIDALAEVYDVHRATAARWVQRAREGLVSGVRRDLERHLAVPAQELESILRIVGDDVDVSVRRLL